MKPAPEAIALLRRLAFLLAATLALGAVHAASLGPLSSSAAGVTVRVTPKLVAAGASTWEFAVALDTHSRDLSDDLVKDSVLIDARGTRYPPIAWEGAPPGGHHRSGVLRFKGLPTLPEAIELQIRRAGEAAPRSFRWNLK